MLLKSNKNSYYNYSSINNISQSIINESKIESSNLSNNHADHLFVSVNKK